MLLKLALGQEDRLLSCSHQAHIRISLLYHRRVKDRAQAKRNILLVTCFKAFEPGLVSGTPWRPPFPESPLPPVDPPPLFSLGLGLGLEGGSGVRFN